MIELITGLPGGGKSYLLVWRALKGMREGRPVFSNFPLSGAYRLDIEILKHAEFPSSSLVLIDEAGLFFNSREWNKFPMEIFQLFSQHRKMKIDMLVVGQDSGMVDINIRRVAQWFWFADPVPIIPFFRYRLYYRAEDIGYLDDRCRKVSFIPKSKKVFSAFDSWAQIIQQNRIQKEFEPW